MSDNDFFDTLPSDMDISKSNTAQSEPIVKTADISAQSNGHSNFDNAPINQQPMQQIEEAQGYPTHISVDDDVNVSKAMQIPQISIQAFYETAATSQLLQVSASDRRMSRAHITMQAGGIVAAMSFYQNAPTPNLIIIESRLRQDELLEALEQLASVCDAGTKVFIMGYENDIRLYRGLVSKGVSDYLVLPTSPINLIETIYNIYHSPESEPLGRKFAFFGAKGGVGSSTLAHNIAYTIANDIQDSVSIVDMDFAFGTLGLNFNRDPNQDLVDLLITPDRIDDATVDKMMIKHSGHLNLLANMVNVEKETDISPNAVNRLLECLSQSVANSVIDLPHVWNDWVKASLIQADQIIITATPDLASLRNTKNIIEFLRGARIQDKDPLVIMNQMGMHKKPEIKTKDFADTIGVDVIAEIAYDPKLFGTAANNGQMIDEYISNDRLLDQFKDLAQILVSKKVQQSSQKKGIFDLFKKIKSA